MLKSRIPYYEVVTVNLTYCNSQIKKKPRRNIWFSDDAPSNIPREHNFMTASLTREYYYMHNCVTSAETNYKVMVDFGREKKIMSLMILSSTQG